MSGLRIKRPFDAHHHFREGEMLKKIAIFTTILDWAVAMGNLKSPVVTADDVQRYREEILQACKDHNPTFRPIMSVMLVRKTTPEIIEKAYDDGFGAKLLKLIPGKTSTNADQGISLDELENYYPCLEKAAELGLIFSGHWEDVGPKGDIPDVERELAALKYLQQVILAFPKLKIIVEHATTKEMSEFVKQQGPNIFATLTQHHALLTTDDVLANLGEVKEPRNYCKPVAKSENDRLAVIKAMISGDPHFGWGSDCAPHTKEAKTKGAAGIFCPPPPAIALLAQIFEQANALKKLETFTSTNGLNFYGLSPSNKSISLIKEDWQMPKDHVNIPYPTFISTEPLSWRLI